MTEQPETQAAPAGFPVAAPVSVNLAQPSAVGPPPAVSINVASAPAPVPPPAPVAVAVAEAVAPPPAFNPILTERQVRRFEFLRQKPMVRARVALVFATLRSGHVVFRPDNPPTMGELLWKGIRAAYEVDMGMHQIRIDGDLPSAGDAFPFHAEIDVQWRVDDPSKIVKDGISDVREALAPVLFQRLRTITRGFDIHQAKSAEDKANRELADGSLGAEFGLWVRFFLRLRMDDPTVQHASAEIGVRRETVLDALNHERLVLRERNEVFRIERRVAAYSAIIASGDVEQFAFQLAQNANNPEDVRAVIQMLKDERDTNRSVTVDFVARLLGSGAIERWEVDDQVKEALQWLKDSTARVIHGPTSKPAIGPVPSDNGGTPAGPAPS
ncbi:hypothetical protein F0L68_29210 [Solihabitans fulvus]|uniref:Uncharacterized protein n=1 Tax=Solihabitans fulvus TaxID=1892852 RepID=A0A5B2WVD6_9PSEU|nr:hypothetical protein [Solihabitans fulvus]KAA2254864.1 hypothetical protein F0L68_29210 [Solihabitans fulvus]